MNKKTITLTAVLFFSVLSLSMQAATFKYLPDVENNKYDGNTIKIDFNSVITSEKITIDGKFTEPVWQNYKKTIMFGRGSDITTVKIASDKENLYIAAECKFKKGTPLRMQERARDNQTWSDECIEMWMWPTSKRNKKGFYQFIVNPLGSIYDGESRKKNYNPEWQVKTTHTDGLWTTEIALPLKEINTNYKASYIKFNIGRNTPSGNFCWTGSYGDIERGRILLNKKAAAEAAVEIDMTEPFVFKMKNTTVLAQERFAEAHLKIPQYVKLENIKVDVKLYQLDSGKYIAEESLKPTYYNGTILADIRKHNIKQLLLTVNVFNGEKLILNENSILKLEESKTVFSKDTKIPVLLDIPEGADKFKDFPVTFGVPFGKGALWDIKNLAVVDSKDNVIPAEFEISGRWVEEGAVKWVRVDTVFSAGENYFVTLQDTKPAAAGGIKITAKTDNEITVENSTTSFVLGKGPSPIKEIKLGGKTVASSAGTKGLYVIDSQGRLASASAVNESMKIESEGPVEVCVRFEGDYVTSDGVKPARHITRVRCYYDKPFADITHTLVINTDTEKLWLKDVGWELSLAGGKGKTAYFGTSAEDQKEFKQVPLSEEAYMIQKSHYRFKHDENKFSIVSVSGGKENSIAEGEECGDWAAVETTEAGLGVICKDSARQHPKEFSIKGDKINLKLFSSRGGEELDFRSPACIKRWGLANQYKHTLSKFAKRNQIERVTAIKSNAYGWTKSHEISWIPFDNNNIEKVSQKALLRRTPIYALISPDWTYQTRALGALYPRTKGKFEEVEAASDNFASFWMSKVPNFGFLGFIDYYASHGFWKGDYPLLRRYSLSYGTRSFFWYLYARSGERKYREYAENVNRTWMDGNFSHLTGFGKVKGLYNRSVGSDDAYRDSQFSLPYYWGGANIFNKSTTTDLNKLMNYYYLTGYRRASDCMYEFADGLKAKWTKKIGEREWRHFGMLRVMQETYQFTFDPEVKFMANFMADYVYRPENALFVTTEKPYNSIYKTHADSVIMHNTWEILRRPELKEMAKKISQYWWDIQEGVLGYANPRAFCGEFLYRENKDPRIAKTMQRMLGQFGSLTAEGVRKSGTELMGPRMKFVLMGFAWAQHIVESAPPESLLQAGDISFTDVNDKASLILQKQDNKTLKISHTTASSLNNMKNNIEVSTDGIGRSYAERNGLSLISLNSLANGATEIIVPNDSPSGNYIFTSPKTGVSNYRYTGTDKAVIHAPDYWQFASVENPARKIYFSITDKCEKPEIFFQGDTKLYTPDGKLFQGKALNGWTALPKEAKGNWYFEVENKGWIKVRDIPPFFALDTVNSLLTTNISWKQKVAAAAETKSQNLKEGFTDGAITLEDNKALYLNKKNLIITDIADDSGKSVIPFREGTIEFFMKPDWDTFSLEKGKSKSLIGVKTNAPEGIRNTWPLSYIYTPDHALWFLHESFTADVICASKLKKDMRARCWRQKIVENNKWIHVAWTWHIVKNSGKKGLDALTSTIYIDGKKGKDQIDSQDLADVTYKPVSMFIPGRTFKGTIDELRISDTARYTGDFHPPARNDKNTLMLFHFNGNLEAESGVTEEKIVAKLK
ncbi:MAG: exo-rhamnogalacturonan lyase family protein [Planctomycetota bacterium]